MKQQNEKQNLSGEETQSKKSPIQTAVKPGTKTEKSSNIWKSVLVGGVPGIIFGVAGTLATEEVATAATDEIGGGDTHGGSAPVHDTAPLASGVNDEMSFSEAFAAARAEVGPGGVFPWHGQVYGTYLKPEWDALTDEQRHDYSQSVANANVHPEPYTPQPDDPPVEILDSNDGSESVTEPADPNSDEVSVINSEVNENGDNVDADVHIIGASPAETTDGEMGDVEIEMVDGQDAAFLDLDEDGNAEIEVLDEGGSEMDASSEELTDDVSTVEYDAPDDTLYEDMPDYTNDADASSLI